jgi:DNA-binding MarR family transcriptional regulator
VAKKSDSATKITFRQKAFLGKVIDIYREMKEPMHYSAIAKKLGLSNSTAYDMLRVLEQKGMIGSQYVTPKEIAGPGRSSILFYPTAQAKEFFLHLTREVNIPDEWENVKARILAGLQQGKAGNYKDLIQELLNKTQEIQSPLAQCAGIVTALLLSLREAKQGLAEQSSVGAIVKAPVSKLRMSILAGLIMGLSLSNQAVTRMLGNYREYTDKYEASLQKLNKEGLVKLHNFTREVWTILRTEPLH